MVTPNFADNTPLIRWEEELPMYDLSRSFERPPRIEPLTFTRFDEEIKNQSLYKQTDSLITPALNFNRHTLKPEFTVSPSPDV
jgi:hypothetical protein